MDSEQRVAAHLIEMPDNVVAAELMALVLGMDRGEEPDDPEQTITAVRKALAVFSSRARMDRVERPLFGLREHPDAAVEMRYELVESGVSELVRIVKEVTPPGREQSLALTNLEQAGLWALCAIGRDKTSGGTG